MRIIYFIILFLIACSSATAQESNYYNILYKGDSIDYKSDQTKKNIADYLSSDNNKISIADINSITIEKKDYILNCCCVDLIKVILNKKVPMVLKPTFLIIVNHKNKLLNNINIDHYYLIKTFVDQKDTYLASINNFRGNLQLSIYQYSQKGFIPFFTKDINASNDCIQYKYDTVTLNNQDTNEDGKLDIVIGYTELIFCNKDGSESEKPLAERNIIKKLIYQPNSKKANWR